MKRPMRQRLNKAEMKKTMSKQTPMTVRPSDAHSHPQVLQSHARQLIQVNFSEDHTTGLAAAVLCASGIARCTVRLLRSQE